jgi:hypothetical protein
VKIRIFLNIFLKSSFDFLEKFKRNGVSENKSKSRKSDIKIENIQEIFSKECTF